MKKILTLLLFASILLVSCRKDDIVDDVTPMAPTPETTFVADVIGQVVDTNDNPISGVAIEAGDINTVSDANGFFQLDGAKIKSRSGLFIKAQSSDYHYAGNRMYTGGIYDRNVKVTMIRKELSGTVSGSSASTVSLPSGLKIDYPQGAFTVSGSDYSGIVNVYAYHLDPSDDDYLERSPGDLSATDDSGADLVLQSFGMVAVEMETPGGETVEIKEGLKATLNVPVDNSLLSEAPQIIPLWHFDEGINKWIKEGEATLQNGEYVGEVAHFSWWNCDQFFDAANLCISIFDTRYEGVMGGLFVQLTSSIGTSTSETDSEGNVGGLVPSGEIFDIIVTDICGEVVHSGTIGPFDPSEEVKEIIIVSLDNQEIYDFTGTVMDCAAMLPITDGIVNLKVEGKSTLVSTNNIGVYNVSTLVCNEGTSYTVVAYSPNESLGGVASGTATFGAPNVLDIGLCNESPYFFIDSTNDDIDDSSEDVEAKIRPNEVVIFVDYSTSGYTLSFSGNSVGTYPGFVDGPNFQGSSIDAMVVVTDFDTVNSVVKGTFSGTSLQDGSSFNGVFVAPIVP